MVDVARSAIFVRLGAGADRCEPLPLLFLHGSKDMSDNSMGTWRRLIWVRGILIQWGGCRFWWGQPRSTKEDVDWGEDELDSGGEDTDSARGLI
uniref:Uncharacterized protein n=1 Tax=Arundo donax TaxID=35708 RepID=A0A0A9G9T9_ARUDO